MKSTHLCFWLLVCLVAFLVLLYTVSEFNRYHAGTPDLRALPQAVEYAKEARYMAFLDECADVHQSLCVHDGRDVAFAICVNSLNGVAVVGQCKNKE